MKRSLQQMSPEQRIVVTGAAGLVGLNLLRVLAERGYRRLAALDKHAGNLPGLESSWKRWTNME